MGPILAAWLVFLSSSLLFSPALACEDCLVLPQLEGTARNSIHRINKIIQMNEEFIASLDPDDESERIKAKSNLSIARKRILTLEGEMRRYRAKVEGDACQKCMNRELKEGPHE